MSSGIRQGILSQQQSARATSFTVFFNSNEGTSVEPVTVNYGALATEPTPPTREGYNFDAWYRDVNVSDQWDFAQNTITSNLILYAGWFVAYTVTFVENGGSTVSDQVVSENNTATNPGAPTRSGYEFGGWFTDDGTFESEFDFINTLITENITLYAKWTEVTDVRGEAVYTSPGTYSLTVPANVTSVIAMTISGGGGGARRTTRSAYGSGGSGAMGYRNSISVTPGETITVVVGGGGLGYYSSNAGVAQNGTESYISYNSVDYCKTFPGWGADVNGNGTGGGAPAGTYSRVSCDGGDDGESGVYGIVGQNGGEDPYGTYFSDLYGKGGASNTTTAGGNTGTGGFVRIVWGNGRAFPSTDIELTE